MRRGVGPDEETGFARCRGLPEREAMPLALGDRQTIEVRPQPALEQRGAVDHEMMRRDRAGDARRVGAHDVERLGRRHVLHDDLQSLMPLQQRQQGLLHEYGFAIKHVDGGIGRLAVDQHRHPDALHALQHGCDAGNIGDAMVGIGGGARGIELGRDPHALGMSFLDFVRRGRICEIASHQRLEITACRPSCEDALTIGRSRFDRGHRRHQIGHDDGARKLRDRVGQDRRQHRAVAQVNVPVVRPADGDGSFRLLRGRGRGEELVDRHRIFSFERRAIGGRPFNRSFSCRSGSVSRHDVEALISLIVARRWAASASSRCSSAADLDIASCVSACRRAVSPRWRSSSPRSRSTSPFSR